MHLLIIAKLFSMMDKLVKCKLSNGSTVIGRNTAIQVTAESRLNYYASCISYIHTYTRSVLCRLLEIQTSGSQRIKIRENATIHILYVASKPPSSF